MLRWSAAAATACLVAGPGWAVPAQADQPLDEGALFADTSSLDSSRARKIPEEEKKSVAFSGTLVGAGQSGVTRSYLSRPQASQSSFATSTVGDISVDARLLRGFRAYSVFETAFDPGSAAAADSGLALRVPEMFLDANLGGRLYFRFGKQVLQWGRCYFFNPTDLINVDRKTFFQRIGDREGAYGLKAQFPVGAAFNIYGFLDMRDAHRPDSLAGAAKIEWLLGGTEMSVMAWDRGGGDPVFGADLSSRVLGLDVNGEWAIHRSFTAERLSFEAGLPHLVALDRAWTSRAALGLGRSFDVGGVPDRVTAVAEFYFNQPGLEDARMPAIPPAFLSAPGSAGALLSAAAASGWYEPNSYSRRYAAGFFTFNRFLRSDMVLVVNAIGNLDQDCAMISAGVSYRDLNDFGLTLYVNGFAGPANTEYTFARQAIQAQLIAQADF